jgi:HSP20 family molecular chaperone IbpA
MSGAIRDVERLNQRQLETARRRNERELKALETSHQNYKADIKETHASEIVDLQDVNHRQINQEAIKKEKVLEEMKTHLHQTTELTEKQLKALKTDAEKVRVENQRKLSYDRDRINTEHELYLDELNHRYNTQAKKLSYDGKNRVDAVKSSLQEEYLNTEEFHQNKLHNKTEEFTTRFKQDAEKHRLLKDGQENEFKKQRFNANQNQQFQLKKMSETHNEQYEKRDNTYRTGLKDQDLFFEKKYGEQLNRHNGEFQTLEDKNQKLLAELKSSLTKEITKVSSKNDDPFFKFETLKPRLTQHEDRVEVAVEIPEHSKQDVNLTINGKDAIVTFNRRYSDASKSPDGSINKINKVETFTSRLATKHILDAKSVKASYEDGVMNYVIKKS